MEEPEEEVMPIITIEDTKDDEWDDFGDHSIFSF